MSLRTPDLLATGQSHGGSSIICTCVRYLIYRKPRPAQQVAPLDDSNTLPNQTYLNEGDTLGGSAVHLSFPELRTEFVSV